MEKLPLYLHVLQPIFLLLSVTHLSFIIFSFNFALKLFILFFKQSNLHSQYLLTIPYLGSGCVAQLVERSLPIPKVRGSNPVIGKIYWTFVYCQLCIEKTKIEKKEARKGPFLQFHIFVILFLKMGRPGHFFV